MESRPATAFLNHLTREDPEQVAEKATHVRILTQSAGWQIVRDLIDREIANVRTQIEWGGVLDDKAEYASLTGRIRGLQQAQGAVDAVLIQAQRNEDAARQAVQEMAHHG